ncbi:hypothetical protein P3L10_030995 [Capsicum annuum]|uniref:uncharacterized protein LOC107847047 n=1 Tax=Capsicum annuum TaxID=4072 RepID=UPI001FB0E22F|nr:uncharacterized protein LOC107847047 [Capsicum annuum]
MLLDDYLYAEESDALDTLQQKMHNFLETLLQISEECDSFLIFLEKYLPLEESIPFEALKTIIYKCDSFNSLSKEYLSDGLKFLKRDFKFLDIILNSQILVDEPDVREKGQVLLQDAEADVIIYSMQVQSQCPYFRFSILKIRAKYSVTKISFQQRCYCCSQSCNGIH